MLRSSGCLGVTTGSGGCVEGKMARGTEDKSEGQLSEVLAKELTVIDRLDRPACVERWRDAFGRSPPN